MATGQAAGEPVPAVDAGSAQLPKRSVRGDWGAVTVNGRQVPIRAVVAVAGIVVWLGLMFLETGAGGIASLWVSLLFLVPLVTIGSLTRSVGLALIGQFVLVGGLMLTVAWVLISLFTTVVPDLYAPIRDFVVPPIEEAAKFAPLVLILWFRRRGTAWSFGATDLLLMGAAIGTGFGLVELAYITGQGASLDSVPFLPIAEIYQGHLVVGHALWATIDGGMLGIALLLQGRGRVAIVAAAAGVAWTTLDHIANNYSAAHQGALADLLLLLTANGWGSLVFFVAVVVLAIAMDLRIVRTAVPRIPELAPPPLRGDLDSVAGAWAFRIGRRGLAYAVFRGREIPEAERPERARMIGDLAYRLLSRQRPIALPKRATPGNAP